MTNKFFNTFTNWGCCTNEFYWLIRAISLTSVIIKHKIEFVLQSNYPHCLQQTVHATAL